MGFQSEFGGYFGTNFAEKGDGLSFNWEFADDFQTLGKSKGESGNDFSGLFECAFFR